jgi:hypothetical protein
MYTRFSCEISLSIYPSIHRATSDKPECNWNNVLITWHYETHKEGRAKELLYTCCDVASRRQFLSLRLVGDVLQWTIPVSPRGTDLKMSLHSPAGVFSIRYRIQQDCWNSRRPLRTLEQMCTEVREIGNALQNKTHKLSCERCCQHQTLACTNPGHQVARPPSFYPMAPKICG